MIDHPDYDPIKVKKNVRCDCCGLKNSELNVQFYFTEWAIQTGASIGFDYCENCILKHVPAVRGDAR